MTRLSEPEPEPPEPVHFARSRSRSRSRRTVLLGAGAGAGAVMLPRSRSRSRSRPKMSRLRIPGYPLSWENPSFLKFQYLCNIRNYFFWPDLRRLPSQQTPNIWYVLVANMLESNAVVRNISEIHLRVHKLRCIPILTLHIQHCSHSPPPAASL